MSRSAKTKVIEYLFFQRWDPVRKELSKDVVTFEEVVGAIHATNAKLMTNNPANFFKDVVRSKNRNQTFPASVVEQGYTARQEVSNRQSFRFIPLPEGQTTAFPVSLPPAEAVANPHKLESVSLTLAARRLGRSDESWLTQVSVRLHVLHTHLALYSPRRIDALDILQTSVKLGNSEIDAILLAHEPLPNGGYSDILVACEMKSVNEELEWEQLERGARATRDVARKDLDNDSLEVIPMAVKTIKGRRLWVIEFATSFPPLEVVSQQVYEFRPPVKGI